MRKRVYAGGKPVLYIGSPISGWLTDLCAKIASVVAQTLSTPMFGLTYREDQGRRGTMAATLPGAVCVHSDTTTGNLLVPMVGETTDSQAKPLMTPLLSGLWEREQQAIMAIVRGLTGPEWAGQTRMLFPGPQAFHQGAIRLHGPG